MSQEVCVILFHNCGTSNLEFFFFSGLFEGAEDYTAMGISEFFIFDIEAVKKSWL